jgi:hypothetical protein
LGWLSAMGDPLSEVRILHANFSRASAFFIFFEKSQISTFAPWFGDHF